MEQMFKDFGYTKIYPKLTDEYEKMQPDLFKLGILIAQQQEAAKGMYMHKKYKSNKHGTRIYFKYMNDKDRLREYKNEINNAANEIIKK